jgi:hypothetical protein
MKTTRARIIKISISVITLAFSLFVQSGSVFADGTNNTCPFSPQVNRTIINFPTTKILNGDSYTTTISPTLTVGTYDISTASFDGYNGRSNSVQPNESWYMVFKNNSSTVAQSSVTSDIPDNVDFYRVDDVPLQTGLFLSSLVNKIQVTHSQPSGTPNYNSVQPVCAAFDLVEPEEVNTPPVITLLGDNPLELLIGDSFSDPGATADDQEDGDITGDIVVGGDTVTTTNTGSFSVTYNVSDSQGATAPQVTRVVNVIAPDNSCPFTAETDRVIVDFSDGAKIRSDQSSSQATSGPVNTAISAGTYKVSLASFDGYVNRIGANQPNEKWFAILKSGSQTVATTGNTTDLRDDLAFVKKVDVVNNTLLVSQAIDAVTAFHSVYPDNSSANSVEPVCAAFDPVPALPQCSDGVDNDGDGQIDYPADLSCDDPNDDSENSPPSINLNGDNPITVIVGGSFTDPSATAADPEDGDITPSLVTGGDTVDPNTLGTYTITYDVTDSQGAAAPQVTRVVNVINKTPECSDGIDNDGDGKIDYPDDLSCDDPNDDNENSPPVITIIGDNPLTVFQNGTFTDPGATALDEEEGDLTLQIIVNGDTVVTATLGDYDVIYNVQDSKGATDSKTRVVSVVPAITTACSDGVDNDGDSLIDISDNACHTDNDENNPSSYDPNIDNENSPPVITLIDGVTINVVVNTTFTDPGATAFDVEDVNLTASIVFGGTVDVNTVGSYTLTYDVTDTGGLSAPQVTRTVNVVPGGGGGSTPKCSDSTDNDGDNLVDANDPGCHTDGDPGNPNSYDPNDDDENSPPAITLTGQGSISIAAGSNFTDPGATAADPEDGDITPNIVTGGAAVDPNTPGSYTITYDVIDSQGAAAPQVTRTVTVNPTGGCVSNCGGGGGGLPSLEITNEILTAPSSGVAVVTWKTNIPATSQVVYDGSSHPTLGSEPDYGYASLTTETTAINTIHRVEITGLTPGTIYYFRPVSKAPNVNRGTGKELTFTLSGGPIIPTGGPTQCTYLNSYLRIDFNNNPEEVRKLQTFLRDFEGFTNLQVTQVFDQATFDAVSAFQERHRSEVLDPWGLPDTTGYVYYTTQKKVNEIFCSKEFPLTLAQLSEIDDFKALLEALQSQPGVPSEEIEGLEGQVGVAPTPSGGGSTLAVTSASGAEISGPTPNVLEASGASGALGILPGANNNVQSGTQVGSLIGTIGTSGALALFDSGNETGTTTGTTTITSGFLATVVGNLSPSIGRGITILGIVILLLYLLLSRMENRPKRENEKKNEYVPDVRDDGEGTILEV